MRFTKGVVIAGVITSAVVVAVFVVGVLQRKPATQETQTVYIETQTTEKETAEALEYVTDENWSALLQAYQSIAANQQEAELLVSTGLADPDGVVSHAAELVEYGKTCERDNLLNSEAEEVLADMSETADKLADLIRQGGGMTAAETTAADAAETAESVSDSDTETEVSADADETDIMADSTETVENTETDSSVGETATEALESSEPTEVSDTTGADLQATS